MVVLRGCKMIMVKIYTKQALINSERLAFVYSYGYLYKFVTKNVKKIFNHLLLSKLGYIILGSSQWPVEQEW